MTSARALALVVVVALSLVAVPLAGVGAAAPTGTVGEPVDAVGPATDDVTASDAVGPTTDDVTASDAVGPATDDVTASDAVGPATVTPPTLDRIEFPERTDEPNTTETIGYVGGYWYDDELPVDDRDDAVLEEDELEAVINRSMARVEVIRNDTFQGSVPVEVISREEFEAETEQRFEEITDEEAFLENVRLEAAFMVDRETDAVEERRTLQSGAVAGYYDPEEDRIVVVSDTPETPEMDEVTLGHELLHAYQDQRFDLTSFDRDTRDQDNAKLGLIEGDAVWVDTEYEALCESEWECVLPTEGEGPSTDFNWGMYLAMFQPYNDGPGYVEYHLEEGGWAAVDALYDERPASSSEIIRPGEERGPVDIVHESTASDGWERLAIEDRPDHSSFGEAKMVAMFAAGAFPIEDETVLGQDDVLVEGELAFDYDQPPTDGWAGDKLVVYATEEMAVEEAGYVWHTEWTDEENAEEFLAAYDELLGIHGAEAVDDRENTYEVEDGYPGAYYLEVDGESVTIVRAPSVDELSEIREGAAPEGEGTIDLDWGEDFGTDDRTADDGDGADGIPGFGPLAALLAVLSVALWARFVRGRRP